MILKYNSSFTFYLVVQFGCSLNGESTGEKGFGQSGSWKGLKYILSVGQSSDSGTDLVGLSPDSLAHELWC